MPSGHPAVSPASSALQPEAGPRRPRFGLEAKFVLLASVGILLATGVGNRLILMYEEGLLLDEARSKAVLLAESMAQSFAYTLIYEELGLVEEAGLLDLFVDDMMGRTDMEVFYVKLLDADGRVRAHSDIRQFGLRDEVFARRYGALSATRTLRLAGAEADTLEVATPLRIASRSWGDLVLGVSLAPTRHELAAFADRLGYLTLAAIGVSVLLSYLVAHALARPVKRLALAMSDVGPDLETPLQVDRRDEIGLLQSSFLDMMARLRRARQEQEHTREALLRAEKLAAVGSLAAGVAHEVSNPLGGIRNCLDQLASPSLPRERASTYMQLMRTALERIEAVVRGLLDFSRRQELETAPVDLVGIVDSSLALVAYRLEQEGIAIERSLDADLPVLLGDGHQLQQVIVNLVLNAADAMAGGGRLCIRAHRCGGEVRLQVEDSGAGIDEDLGQRIFDPFFTTKPVGKGTGLGLTVCLHILREHGGDLSYARGAEGGTTFTLTLPVTPPRRAGQEDES